MGKTEMASHIVLTATPCARFVTFAENFSSSMCLLSPVLQLMTNALGTTGQRWWPHETKCYMLHIQCDLSVKAWEFLCFL